MSTRKWKLGRAILPLLLSAVMVMEPAASAATVYAEEGEYIVDVTQEDQTNDTAVEEVPVDDAEITDQAAESADEAGSEQANGQEDEDSTENNVGEGTESPSEDVGEQGDSSEAEEGENSDTDVDGEEELPEEELPDEELSDEELTGEEEIPVEDELEEEPKEDVEKKDAEDEALLGFEGMPDGYRLTAAQQEEKSVLADYTGNLSEADEGILYVKGEIMTFADSQEEAEMIAEAFNAKIKSFDSGLLVMTLGEKTTVATAIRAAASSKTMLPAVWPNYYRYLYADEIIEVQEAEYEVEADTETADVEDGDIPSLESYERVIDAYSDPYLSPTSDQYQWQHVAVGSAYAWKADYTGKNVKVAVLDTGVLASHEDLTIAGSYDASPSASPNSDIVGHGTHVAGIIGAKSNTKGGVGIAPDATLYSIKVFANNGETTDDIIIRGISRAIELDVDIVNMSLGGPAYNNLLQKKVTEAYKAGIAVFASAGNDGISCYNYPAALKNVICVAATDTNSGRADFSTYGSWVDISAPGVNIWSTYNNGGYASLSGTSMACPVAAGEAAVLLSSHSSLQGKAKDNKRVDALLKLMKSNTVKASGSGMGSGIVSLTKAFKLSTATTKPNAPTIEITPDDKSAAQNVTVTIRTTPGVDVYYTTDGKNPVYKNGERGTGTIQYAKPFTINNSAKGTIKAIAVNESGVASAVKSASYTLKPYVTKIDISGVQKVAKGKSIQLSAEVSPAYAANKGIDWKLQTTVSGVTVSSSGKVTVAGNAATGSVTVVAAAKDRDGMVTATYTIQVIDKVNISSVKFKNKSVSLKMPNDKSYSLTQEGNFEATSIDGTAVTAADFKWTSSNKAIATVDANGVITPVKAGKATITALANDSSGKKATCTVTVTQLATGVEISGPTAVGVGKSVTLKAEVKPSNTNNKKVTWKLYKGSAEVGASEGISISSSGKVTAKAPASGIYTVRAYSADNEAVYGQAAIRVTSGTISRISFADSKDSKVKIFRKRSVSKTPIQKTVNLTIEGSGDTDLDAYTVSNSNKGIATVTHARSGGTIALTITATGKASGTTKITVASTDGSNKKVTCNVTVANPVSKVHIASKTLTSSAYRGADMVVVKTKSIQLQATLESEYGKISGKGVTWEINAPSNSGVKISKSGKVSASSSANVGNIYTVTATAKDGSLVSAIYNVMVVPKATTLRVPALEPRPGYVGVWTNPLPDKDNAHQFLQLPIYEDVYGGYITVSSSNKKVVEVAVYTDDDGYRYLLLSPQKAGRVTITLKATDGSGKKASYMVEVRK